jgi:hypothetical protein
MFNYKFISLLLHLYWKNNLNTIAMFQLLSFVSNIIIYNNTFISEYTYIINIPINIILFYRKIL